MPSIRRALLALGACICLAFFPACDSSEDGPPPSDLEGTYTASRFYFRVAGVNDFDLLADTLATPPRLEFFGGNARANLVFRLEGSGGSSFLAARFSTGENRVTVDFSDEPADARFQLLLPEVVNFQLQSGTDELVTNQEVEEVDLARYAPERYGGLTQPVNGTLEIRLARQQTP
jgi:hypothetical protein